MTTRNVSGREGKNVPDTASCFKNIDRFRIRLIVDINIPFTLGDSK
jgi:hypothetical protein